MDAATIMDVALLLASCRSAIYDDYYNDYAYDYGDDCYQLRHVRTRYGWRLRRIDVCGNSYY